MKNFTLKMKSVLFSVLAVLAMATPATAQVNGVADLFGKYKFTAKIEYTEAGKAFEGQYKETSDVTIEKHNVYDGQIVGLAGSDKGQTINGWNEKDQTLSILNPSFGGVWGKLAMSNNEGVYPYRGMQEGHEDAWSVAYSYNAKDGSISIPDFTLGECDYDAETFKVCVKFTNVKLELVQLDKVEVNDISGDWHYNAGKGPWDSMEGSKLPAEFDLTLVATNPEKTNYTAKLVYGDFAPVEIEADFNGSVFNLNLDSTALDVKEKIYLISSYSATPYEDKVSFNYTDAGSLVLSSGLTVVRCDSIAPDKLKAQLQWFQSGVLKKAGGDVAQQTWDGSYKMKAEQVHNIAEGAKFPQEFTMKVNNTDYGYFVTELLGYEIPNGGFSLVPDKANPNKAVIPVGYASFRNIGAIEPGKTYYALGDQNGQIDGDIHLTLNADNTLTMDNISVLIYNWETKEAQMAGAYVGVKGTKEAAPEVPEFSWNQTFKVTAEVEAINKDYTYPTEFNMVVVYDDIAELNFITEFFGNNVKDMNWGGIMLDVSPSNPLLAAMAPGKYIQTIEPGASYLTMADAKGENNPILVKADEQGNLTFDDFGVMLFDYNTQASTLVAVYKNVKATLVATGIESVQHEAAKVSVSGNTIKLNKEQAVQVYNITGKCVFSGVASEVSQLVKGLYLVKTATGVAKVLVR